MQRRGAAGPRGQGGAPAQGAAPSGPSTPAFRVWSEGGRVFFDVLVVPRASRSAVAGVHDDRLKVTLAAPPVDGRANEALVDFLARALQKPKRDVTIVRGEKGRKKTIAVTDCLPSDVMRLVSA